MLVGNKEKVLIKVMSFNTIIAKKLFFGYSWNIFNYDNLFLNMKFALKKYI